MSGTGRSRRRAPRPATPERLEAAALHYLGRFASSVEALRRVLRRRVRQAALALGTDPAPGYAVVEALLERFQASGLLDDRRYAAARAASLQRAGGSTRAIRARLRAKGVPEEAVAAALAERRADEPDPELAAAVAYARRRRLGPWRPAAARRAARERDLAALARAGFAYDLARRVIEAPDAEALEAEAGGG